MRWFRIELVLKLSFLTRDEINAIVAGLVFFGFIVLKNYFICICVYE